MKASLALSTALATTASAARQSFKSLSASDRTLLEEQLDKWKASYGPIAEANGFFPQTDTTSARDWSTSKCNSPITNQGKCGSCWAFATIGTVEYAHCIATGELLDLSEQQLVSCFTNGVNRGCDGGSTEQGLDWVQQGVCTEQSYPYTSGKGQTGACQASCTKKKLSIGKTKTTSGESSLLTVLESQPAAVFVESANAVWRNYKGGIVSQCPGAESNHAVVVVGYSDNYFKIKNSWGSQWGDKGYIYLKRGLSDKGVCNMAETISYPELIGSSPTPSSNPTPSSSQQPTQSTRKPPSSDSKPSTGTPMTSTPSSSKPTPFPSSFAPEPSPDTPMTPSSSKPTYPTHKPFPSSFPPKPSTGTPM
ncbi:hypothetical protein DYB31_013673, partial [Aphanomyces astaci]